MNTGNAIKGKLCIYTSILWYTWLEQWQTLWVWTRVRHFYAKVRISIGAVWISFTNVSSRSEKKDLGLYLVSRPPLEPQHFFKGIRPKIQRKNLTFSFFKISLMKSRQNGFLRSHIKMSDKYGSFDTHIAIFYGILCLRVSV